MVLGGSLSADVDVLLPHYCEFLLISKEWLDVAIEAQLIKLIDADTLDNGLRGVYLQKVSTRSALYFEPKQ